ASLEEQSMGDSRHRCAVLLSRGVHAGSPWAAIRGSAGISLYVVVAIHGGRDSYFGAWRTCIWLFGNWCWGRLVMLIPLPAACACAGHSATRCRTWSRPHLTSR